MADVIEGKQTLELTYWSSLKSSNFHGSKAGGTGVAGSLGLGGFSSYVDIVT
jgi:hypothetical protein